jgi:zinc/manganese transport system substrate-binding protein
MILIIVPLILAGVAVSGCGGASDEEGPQVVATTGVLKSIAYRIAGDGVEVDQLIPDGADPHDFALSAEDRQTLEEADLVLANGAGLEAGIPLDETGATVFELVDHAGELREGDPHVWMDPSRIADATPAIADALAEADPANAAAYRRRAKTYAEELRGIDESIAEQVETVPADDRKLVTSHDAFGYFADRYGFEVVASPFGSLGAGGEPSAEALQEAIAAVEETGVPAVFAQAEDDPSAMESVAEETGVEIVDGLLVESPGYAGTYDRMMVANAEQIVAALDADPATAP